MENTKIYTDDFQHKFREIDANSFFYHYRNAGFPDDPAMHGIIAGLWSSLSGAGRFVSRLGSGIMVDHIGFDNTATIFTALQVITVSSRNSFGVVTVTWNYCF